MTSSSSPKQKRINARIDAALAAKIELLRSRTGKTSTEVVRAAIERYYEALMDPAADPMRLLEASGFVGCAEGDEELSADYKAALAQSLEAKRA
ncbi:MAG: ribbon-helix-helix domain-containing protein [bacterium]